MMSFLTYITGFFMNFGLLPSKFIKNPVKYVKKLIIMLIQFKFEHFLAWPPLLKIEISSNGQNCSILSQKVSKFELYKHNDELFNIYYGIFNEL
jgi:hypothetical protein